MTGAIFEFFGLVLLVVNCFPISSQNVDYVTATRYLDDGEMEMWFGYGDVCAKELSVANKNVSDISFRQITNGHRLLQLIFNGETVKDCQLITSASNVRSFLDNFDNSTSRHDYWSTVEGDPPGWLSGFSRWLKICKRLRKERRMEAIMREESEREAAESLEKYGGGRSRNKRGLFDVFRLPGTQWCGKGYSASKYTDVGIFSRTDRCCRQHDLACPFWIGALETKYGVHNFMVNTLMHCSCDERFRACLKRVGTADANLVGSIFFNYVQRECFTLEPKKRCHKKYHQHPKRKNGKYAKRKSLNPRRTKRNERKCKRITRKAIIRRNLVY